ncbi:phosphohistidine phosphatase SixA [Bibersteinia trehalosi]|uniref:Phosphohistidine phosphatase SixA n=1 Tax=Bibersteinia trehalosi TaxID=47735 RepID=A0A426FIZ8_BIBTR|nr:phosphohistidine phosphatase SixA [Bibersteinia trehalosi]RRN04541.1 phosphohistidine phosphatase SixA [Bibersteinia trehalosi]
MKIWIMRHAEAGFNAPSDSLRTLTPDGLAMAKAQGKKLGEQFKQQHIALDKLLVSPYIRAMQTKEALIEGMQAVDFSQNFSNIEEQWDGITPDGIAESVLDYLSFLREEGARNVLIVSHLPLVFELVQALTQFQASVHFYPAVVAEIDWHRNNGQLISSI